MRDFAPRRADKGSYPLSHMFVIPSIEELRTPNFGQEKTQPVPNSISKCLFPLCYQLPVPSFLFPVPSSQFPPPTPTPTPIPLPLPFPPPAPRPPSPPPARSSFP